MDHILLAVTNSSFYKYFATTILFTIFLASILGLQGCANRMAYYGDRYVGTLQISNAIGVGRGGYDKPNVKIAKLDFIPIDRDDYKLKWTGSAITYLNCYHFEPVIELEEPAPKTFTRDFDIVKDRWWIIADEMIGGFSVTFYEGSRVPDEIKYNDALISSSQVPPGTPATVYGKFWMGCTKKKKIKANADKDGEDGNLYITLSPVMIPADGVTIGGIGSSPKHHVSCETISGGGGGGAQPARTCNFNQKCCGALRPDGTCLGQCWPKDNPCP